MRIHTKIVLDMETLAVVEDCHYEYSGPVALCKGESKTQMDTNNQLAKQQFAMQQDFLNRYKDYVNKLVGGGGYMPGVKEAAVSNAVTSVPLNFDQIRRQLATNGLRTGTAGGGAVPGSGLAAANDGSLLAKEAMTKAGLLNDITLKGQDNINSAEAGVLNAGLGTGNTGSNVIGSATSAANEANKSQGLLGTIIGGGLGVLGQAVGKGGALAGCWVAAQLYGGWFAPETVSIRAFIFTTWYMKPFAWLYSAFGERWAQVIQQQGIARRATKRLFDLFLRVANGRKS